MKNDEEKMKKSPKKQQEQQQQKQPQLESAFWNADSGLVVKDMLAVSTKKTKAELHAFKKKLTNKINSGVDEQLTQQQQDKSKVMKKHLIDFHHKRGKSELQKKQQDSDNDLFHENIKQKTKNQFNLEVNDEDSDDKSSSDNRDNHENIANNTKHQIKNNGNNTLKETIGVSFNTIQQAILADDSNNLHFDNKNGDGDDSSSLQDFENDNFDPFDFDYDDKMQERDEQTKIAKLKDLYQSHLHEMLLQRQNLEKQLRLEKTIRLRLENEIKYLKNKLDVEVKTMKQNIEEEYRKNFTSKKNEMWGKFQHEQQITAMQYQELRQYQSKRAQLVMKISKVLVWQENDVTQLRTQLRQVKRQLELKENPNKLSLLSKGGPVIQPKEDKEESLKIQELENNHREELQKYQEHIEFLDIEVEQLKGIMLNWINQVTSLNEQVKEVKSINEKMRMQHKNEVAHLTDQYENQVKDLQIKLKTALTHLAQYKTHINSELNLKEELQSRLTGYIDVLQNEVKTAKRIIKNPKLREKAFKELNFEKIYYYDYIPKSKEEGKPEDKYDRNRVKIVQKQRLNSKFYQNSSYLDNQIMSGTLPVRSGSSGGHGSLISIQNQGDRGSLISFQNSLQNRPATTQAINNQNGVGLNFGAVNAMKRKRVIQIQQQQQHSNLGGTIVDRTTQASTLLNISNINRIEDEGSLDQKDSSNRNYTQIRIVNQRSKTYKASSGQQTPQDRQLNYTTIFNNNIGNSTFARAASTTQPSVSSTVNNTPQNKQKQHINQTINLGKLYLQDIESDYQVNKKL
eukprot:403362312